MSITCGFDTHSDVLIIYLWGTDGYQQIRDKYREMVNSPLFHPGQTRIFIHMADRDPTANTNEEVMECHRQLAKAKPSSVTILYFYENQKERVLYAKLEHTKHNVPCQIFYQDLNNALKWMTSTRPMPEKKIHSDYYLNTDLDLMISHFWGTGTLKDMLEAIHLSSLDPNFKPGITKVYNDINGMVLTDVDWDVVLKKYGETITQYNPSMLAIYYVGKELLPEIQVATKLWNDIGVPCNHFTSLQRAMEWLLPGDCGHLRVNNLRKGKGHQGGPKVLKTKVLKIKGRGR